MKFQVVLIDIIFLDAIRKDNSYLSLKCNLHLFFFLVDGNKYILFKCVPPTSIYTHVILHKLHVYIIYTVIYRTTVTQVHSNDC